MAYDDEHLSAFSGFRELDFQQVNGTHWRKELGRELIDVMGREFKAWPIYRWQGLHIGPEKFDQPDVEAAKFFVHIEEGTDAGIRFGLYIESASREEADKFVHWRNFRNGLTGGGKVKAAFEEAVAKHHLTIAEYSGGDPLVLHWEMSHRESGRLEWVNGEARKETSFEAVIEQIAVLPKDEWVNFYIFARLGKHEAIALGEKVSEPIGRVLLGLVPLYFQIISADSK